MACSGFPNRLYLISVTFSVIVQSDSLRDEPDICKHFRCGKGSST